MGRRKQKKHRPFTHALLQELPAVEKKLTGAHVPGGFFSNLKDNWGATWFIWVVIVSIAFLVLKMFTMNAYVGDEHIYLFQGKLVADGITPYQDFSMAHPPLQSIFTAVLFKLFGYHFLLGRILPVFFALFGGLLLSVLVRRELGAVASVVAVTFVFFAYEPLRASSHYTGVNMTWAFLIGALLAYRTNYIKICAVLCVAAVFTRLYAAPFAIAIIMWGVITNWRRGVLIAAWSAGISVALVALLCFWAGFENTFDNLLAYHLDKTPMSPERLANDKANLLFHNAVPVLIYLLSLPVLFASIGAKWRKQAPREAPWIRLKKSISESKGSLAVFSAIAAWFFLIMLNNMDRVWMYYYVPIFPFAAILAGFGISRWFEGAKSIIVAKGRFSELGLTKSNLTAGVFLTIIFALLFVLSPRLESNLKYWDKNIKLPESARTKIYTWKPGLLPNFINVIVKATLWNEKRIIGEPYFFYNYYLWHESRSFNRAQDITEEIQRRTDKGDCIFGDSGSVPLLALLSERCIAGHEVDTNLQRYKSGAASPVELVKKIDKDSTKIIVLRPHFGVGALPHLKELVRNKYKLVQTFTTAQNKMFRMYERK